MDRREAYREKLEAQLKELKGLIDQLENGLTRFSSEARSELSREIHNLRSSKMMVRERWNEMQKAGEEAWDTMKEGVEKALAELKESLEKVRSRFR